MFLSNWQIFKKNKTHESLKTECADILPIQNEKLNQSREE